MSKITVTPEALSTSARKYRKDLIKSPIRGIGEILGYFTVRTGIRYGETVGELSGGIEVGPYDASRVDKTGIGIDGRTLYTYFGSVIKEFDPNSVVQTIYGNHVTKGDGLKNADITMQVLHYLAALIGKGLRLKLFNAVRKDDGTKTEDLFNGFDTITATEIAAGNISKEKKNLYEFTDAITSDNAVDLLTSFCRAASDELLDQADGGDPETRGTGINLYVPRSLVYAYRDDYLATVGHAPVYDKFNQTKVIGFDNITLVPVAGKADSQFIQMSTKKNMLIGTDQMSDTEQILVEKHAALILQFVATMFFGVNYESISPDNLLVGKLVTA